MGLRKNLQIYLDHQATTPTAPEVVAAMLPYFSEQFGNPHSSDHQMGWKAASVVDTATSHVARMLGADPDEIIFTSGATEANNLALFGLVRSGMNLGRTKMLVGDTEHKCVLAAASAASRKFDIAVERIPVDKEGCIDLSWLQANLDETTLLVSVMAVNNEIGTIAPLREVSAMCRKAGALFHTDAAQAPNAISVSELASIADLVSLSAHKMYGPKGVGALFVTRELQKNLEPIIHGGGQQNNLRSGTTPVPLVVGFGKACELHDSSSTEELLRKVSRKTQDFFRLLREVIPDVELNGPSFEKRHPGNLNVRLPCESGKDLLLRLQPEVCASTGSACTSGFEEPSHVLRAIGLSAEQAGSSVRFSIGTNTTTEELQRVVEKLNSLLRKVA